MQPNKREVREILAGSDPVSFVPMDCLNVDNRDFSARETRHLDEVFRAYTYFRDGDVLMAKITPCFENGKLGVAKALTNGVGFGSSEFFVIRPDRTLLGEFLYHFLNQGSFRADAKSRMTGAVGHKRVPKELIEDLSIPLPPLEEQQRIVAILDEAFEGLDRARANAEANLQNARELFSVAIEARLERAGGTDYTLARLLEKNWILSHLDGNHGSNYPRKEEFVAEGVPYISANCIDGDIINLNRCKFLPPARADTLRKGTAKNRDVIFAHNATVGPVALLQTDEPRILLSTSLTHYRCNEDYISPEFLVFAMRSAGFKRQYEAVMGQATRNQVPITIQRTFTHKIPSMDEQLKIAELGKDIERATRELAQNYELQRNNVDEIRQSLLRKAFVGELI